MTTQELLEEAHGRIAALESITAQVMTLALRGHADRNDLLAFMRASFEQSVLGTDALPLVLRRAAADTGNRIYGQAAQGLPEETARHPHRGA